METIRPRLIIIFSFSTILVVIVLLVLIALRSSGPDLQMEAAGELGVEAGGGLMTPPSTPLPQEPPSLPQMETAVFFDASTTADSASMSSSSPDNTMPGGEEPPEPWLGLEWQDAADKGYVPGGGSPLAITGRILDPWGNPAPYVHIDAYLVLADGSLQGYVPPAATVNPYPCISLFDNYCPPDPFTDADGYYSIAVSAPGMYKLFFNGMVALTTGETESWAWWNRVRWPAAEWYNNYSSPGVASLVPAGSTGVDAILVPKGVLAGNVNSYGVLFAPNPDASAPNPPAVYVTAYRADREELVESASVYSRTNPYSNVIHSFFFDGLLPGEYKILANPDYSGWDLDYYGSQLMKPTWFGGAESWEAARRVLVTGESVSTIEIKMNEVGTGGTAATTSQTFQEPSGAGEVANSSSTANGTVTPEPVVATAAAAPEMATASDSATTAPVSNESASLPAPLPGS